MFFSRTILFIHVFTFKINLRNFSKSFGLQVIHWNSAIWKDSDKSKDHDKENRDQNFDTASDKFCVSWLISRFLSFFSNLNKFRSFSPQPSQGTCCLLAPSSCRSGCRPQWGWSSGVRSQSCTNHSSRTTSQTRCEECEPKIILCNNECCGRVFKYHNHKKQICVPFLEV